MAIGVIIKEFCVADKGAALFENAAGTNFFSRQEAKPSTAYICDLILCLNPQAPTSSTSAETN